jgi:hypothetical protein
MEKSGKLIKAYRATEDKIEVEAVLIGMPKTPLSELAHQLAMLGGQNTLSEEEQFKLRYLELPRYEYGAQPLPVNVSGPGVDLSRVLPIEILVKVIELLSPPTCLILAEVNKSFSQILKEESFWKTYCERLLRSPLLKEYNKVLDNNTLSFKRLAFHVFGNPDRFVFYSNWTAHQQLERSKTDEKEAKDIKKQIKKKKFPLLFRFETLYAHDFEIRLPHCNFNNYLIAINLTEYEWQIEHEEGLKDYLWLCAEAIKKFCSKVLEEKKKTVPVKKHKWIEVNYTIIFTGFTSLHQKFFENGAELMRQGARFHSLDQISTYFNMLLANTPYPPRMTFMTEVSNKDMMQQVYLAILDLLYFSSMSKMY